MDFFLHHIPPTIKGLFLRYLAKNDLLEEVMFELIHANHFVTDPSRNFIARGICPVKNKTTIIGDLFPWERTWRREPFWCACCVEWTKILTNFENGHTNR